MFRIVLCENEVLSYVTLQLHTVHTHHTHQHKLSQHIQRAQLNLSDGC